MNQRIRGERHLSTEDHRQLGTMKTTLDTLRARNRGCPNAARATVGAHGSSMADTGVPAEVAKACLAHVLRSGGVQACQRSDFLTRRAEVLQAWNDYIG